MITPLGTAGGLNSTVIIWWVLLCNYPYQKITLKKISTNYLHKSSIISIKYFVKLTRTRGALNPVGGASFVLTLIHSLSVPPTLLIDITMY